MIADDQERPDPVLGQLGGVQTPDEHEEIEPERDEHAEKAVLLGQTEKTKSLWATGQEPIAALGALPEALAEQPAGPTVTLA